MFEILQAIERTFDTFKVPLMAYDFGKAVAAYAQGMLNEDREQKIQALRWLRAETDTKTEAKKTLGIGTIINDTNWFDALKTFDELVVKSDTPALSSTLTSSSMCTSCQEARRGQAIMK